jgi:hypothetical protein
LIVLIGMRIGSMKTSKSIQKSQCWFSVRLLGLGFRGLGFRVDVSVSEYLRTQRRLNSHTLFLGSWSTNNIDWILTHCSSTLEAQITFVALYLVLPILTKIVQFHSEMGRILGVWCKGVQCSMMSKLNQIRILSFDNCIFVSKIPISFVKSYLGHPLHF